MNTLEGCTGLSFQRKEDEVPPLRLMPEHGGILKAWRRRRCQKLGHKPRRSVRFGMRKISNYRAVAEKVSEQRTICSRCKALLEGPTIEPGQKLQGITCSADQMRILDDGGVLWE